VPKLRNNLAIFHNPFRDLCKSPRFEPRNTRTTRKGFWSSRILRISRWRKIKTAHKILLSRAFAEVSEGVGAIAPHDCQPTNVRRNPFRVETFRGVMTQGSAFRATLGCVPQSLWDWNSFSSFSLFPSVQNLSVSLRDRGQFFVGFRHDLERSFVRIEHRVQTLRLAERIAG
jgi:hypothetical protein